MRQPVHAATGLIAACTNALCRSMHHGYSMKACERLRDIHLCAQTTARRWHAVECAAQPMELMGDCSQQLTYLRQIVPVIAGFAGLGLPEPEQHGQSSRPASSRGALVA